MTTSQPINSIINSVDKPWLQTSRGYEGETAFELVVLTLTIPLWTFVTLYLLLLLIHYLRRLQNFTLYDRCSPKNAHFTYHFHIVLGRTSANYNTRDSHLIVDLLDNQLISAITVQVPGNFLFNDSQIFMYTHSRNNLRCVSFTIYRRHPIKDVRCIRIAHSCSNPDSRLFIYGLNLYDSTNAENKFFPITSVVKNRGTQWALNSSFEPKGDLNFSKMGCDCYDPFGTSMWPTYIELLVIIFYLWTSALFFGSLITLNLVFHCLTITFLAGTSAVVIAFVYIRLVKYYSFDQHCEATSWLIIKSSIITGVIIVCLVFWSVATRQIHKPKQESTDWSMSSVISSSVLTLILMVTNYVLRRRKMAIDSVALGERDAILAKTNSKPNLEFNDENNNSFFSKPLTTSHQQQQAPLQPLSQPLPQPNQQAANQANKKSNSGKTTNSGGSIATKASAGSNRKGSSRESKKRISGSSNKRDVKHQEETLDNVFNSDGAYMKTKNRNSISQYV